MVQARRQRSPEQRRAAVQGHVLDEARPFAGRRLQQLSEVRDARPRRVVAHVPRRVRQSKPAAGPRALDRLLAGVDGYDVAALDLRATTRPVPSPKFR